MKGTERLRGRLRRVRGSYIIKQILAVSMILILMVSLFAISSYQLFSYYFHQEIMDFNTKVLSYIRDTTDNTVFQRMESVAINAVMDDASRNDVLFFTQKPLSGNHARIPDSVQALKDIGNGLYGIADSVQMYYSDNDFVLSNKHGMTYLSDSNMRKNGQDWVGQFLALDASSAWLISSGKYDASGEECLITYVKTVPFHTTGKNCSGAIAISITESVLRSRIQELDYKYTGAVMIVDENGGVISHPDRSTVTLAGEEEAFFDQIKGKEAVQFLDRSQGPDLVVNAAQSRVTGWYYVFSVDAGEYYQKGLVVRNSVILGCIATILLALILVRFLTVRLSNPFGKLLSHARAILTEQSGAEVAQYGDMKVLDETLHVLQGRMSDLNQLLERNRDRISNTFFRNLLSGRVTSQLEIDECIAFMGGGLEGPFFACVMLRLHYCMEPSAVGMKSSEFILYSTAEQIRQWAPEIAPVVLGRGSIVLICSCQEVGIQLHELFADIAGYVKEQFSAEVTFGVGAVVDTPTDIHLSMEQAREAVAFGAIYPGAPIFYWEVCDTATEPDIGALDQLFASLPEFAGGNGERLEQFINLLRDQILADGAAKALDHTRSELPEHIRRYQLSLHIPLEETGFEDLRLRLEGLFFLEDILGSIAAYLTGLAAALKQRYSTTGGQYAEKAREYVERRFANTELSLDEVAGSLFISSAHLSRIFKETVGESFSDYLLRIRMEEAKRLLSATDYSVKEIAQAVGYADSNYFNKRFKSFYGVTPTQYRKAQGGPESDA